MRKTFINRAIFPCLLFLVACTNDIVMENISKTTDINTIEVTANDFVYDDIQTRTNFEITESGVKFTWAANDTVGIFPDEGRQVSFPMASGAGSNKALFTGGGWALKPSSTYNAYFPLIGKFYLDKQAIPLSYTGQTQVGNATTNHLGKYDYMVAAAISPAEGKVNFNFNRLNSLVRLTLEAPGGSSYTQIKLESEGLFLNKGSLDLSTQKINYLETSNTFILDLEEITTTAAKNTLELYLMLAPTDLSEKEIIATIIDDKNNSTTTTFAGRNFVAGKAYNLTENVQDTTVLDINVGTPGSLSSLLNGTPPTEIVELKLSGTLNNTDIITIQKMKGLKILDVENVSFTKEDYQSYYQSHMFSGLTSLEKVIWSKNMTLVPYGTFYGCEKLKEIEFKNSIIEIQADAFSNCGFESFEIPATVNSLGNPFAGCRSLQDLTVSPGNNTYTINNGIIYSNAVRTLVFAQPNLSGVVQIPNSVTYMQDRAFKGTNIVSVILNDKLTSIQYETFMGCKSLTNVYWSGSNLRSIDSYAFQGCRLTDLYIPEGVNTLGEYAFSYNSTAAKCILSLPSTLQYIGANCFTSKIFSHIYMFGLPEDFVNGCVGGMEDDWRLDSPFDVYYERFSIVHIRKTTTQAKWYNKFFHLDHVAKEWIADL